MPWFGAAGNSESFYEMGYRSMGQVPEYLCKMEINAYEYQCGRGVRTNEQQSAILKRAAEEAGIRLSLHAPYYISLSSVEAEKRAKSVEYILQSAQAAKQIGADRIVVHSGSCSKMTRADALALAKDTLLQAVQRLRTEGLSEITICPETMGKINQLGTFEEVLELCRVDESFLPCIDFGHLNARTLGGLKELSDYEAIFTGMRNALGEDRMLRFHAHFSKIEYTAGGEKRHLTFADQQFGPDFEPIAELICKYGCDPVFICESAGTQAEDAREMRRMYLNALQHYERNE